MAETKAHHLDEYILSHNECQKQINLLNEEGIKMKERIANLQKHFNSFTSEARQEIQELKKQQQNQLNKYQQLLTVPATLKNQQAEIEQLKKENVALKARIEQLESAFQILEVSQLMTEFSRNVSKFVLEPEGKVGLNGGLTHMLDSWLQPEVDEKWKRLQSVSKIIWTPRHQMVVKEIKSNRNELAHSIDLDYTLLKQQVEDKWSHWGEECDHIIEMHKKLNHLLVLGAFSFDFQKVVWSYILPGKDGMDISQLVKQLEEEDEAANQRWVKLTHKLKTGWSKNHETALQEMTQLKRGKTILHEIDFEEAKIHVADYVSSKKKSSEIIDMMKILPNWELPKNTY